MEKYSKIIYKCVAYQLNISQNQIEGDSTTFKELGATNLDILEIKIAVEDELNIRLPKLELKVIKSIGDLINFFKKNVKG